MLECANCSANKAKLQSACQICRAKNAALQRYAEANIPIKYWYIPMDSNFRGDSILMEKYTAIVADLKASYQKGISLCFAGPHGIGKTMTCTNILKRVVEKGYSGRYVTLNDIVANLVSNYEGKTEARRELLTVDFLVIDEFDPRYMGSENAADLFGRVLEDIIRTRAQNLIPTLTCTNSPKPTESFTGPLKASITSLMNYFIMVSVLGKDMRKEGK